MRLSSEVILVAGNALLDAFDDLERGVNTHVGCYEHLLKVVKHIVVDGRLAGNGTRQLVKHAVFRLLKTTIKYFFLVFVEKSKYSH